jgi:adenylate cyclase
MSHSNIVSDPKLENVEASIVTLDLKGFSAVATEMTPAELASFLNAFYCEVEASVAAHAGKVERLMGDQVLMSFRQQRGKVAAQQRAAHSAIEIKKRLKKRWPFHDVSFGISTGNLAQGRLGISRTRTMVGRTIMDAFELERVSHKNGFHILADERTAEGLTEAQFRRVQYKWKGEDVSVIQINE